MRGSLQRARWHKRVLPAPGFAVESSAEGNNAWWFSHRSSEQVVIDDKREKKMEDTKTPRYQFRFCQTSDEPSRDVSQNGEKEQEGDLGVIGSKVLVVVGRNTLV